MMSLSVVQVLPSSCQHQRNPQPWTDVSATKADQEQWISAETRKYLTKINAKAESEKKNYMDDSQDMIFRYEYDI